MGADIVRRFDVPDERQEFALGHLDLVTLGALTIGYEYMEPGWRWSTHVKPVVQTERCEHHHVGYQVSGVWVSESRDGIQTTVHPGQLYDVAPGHDAWIVGDEPSVSITFQGSADYARPRGSGVRVLATLVFSDIVGSTEIAAHMGDESWTHALRAHLEDVTLLLEASHGVLVQTTGDGILARFDSPADGVRFALAIQEASSRQGLRIRVGVHSAEVEMHGDDVRGLGVHLASRVMAAAEAGQILVTATTRELAAGSGVAFTDRGPHELKGIDGARVLYEVQRA
jgi:class 3 adenylate cyclase